MTCSDLPSCEARAVVIGVGNSFRRDDGVGEAVISRMLARWPAGAPAELRLVASDGEPARIVETWAGAELAVVVDALCSEAEPGTVERVNVESGHRDDLATVRSQVASSVVSGHAAGVAEAIVLAAALDRLPRRLVIYTVAGDDFGNGPGLSRPVASAVDRVVDAVRELLLEARICCPEQIRAPRSDSRWARFSWPTPIALHRK